jgi:hypothetical protein
MRCDPATDGFAGAPAAGTDVVFPQIRIGLGATAPAIIEAGPTTGWLFAVGSLAYSETPLHPRLNRTQNIVVGIGWAPSGSQAGRTVTWRLAVLFAELGSTVTVIDETIDALDQAVPPVVATYARSSFVITPAMLAAHPTADELHMRLTRVATAADPAVPPGLHHVAVIQVTS